jgi:hypothetical protein
MVRKRTIITNGDHPVLSSHLLTQDKSLTTDAQLSIIARCQAPWSLFRTKPVSLLKRIKIG